MRKYCMCSTSSVVQFKSERLSHVNHFLCRKEVVQWVGRSLSEIGGMEVYWQNYSVNIPVVALPSKVGLR